MKYSRLLLAVSFLVSACAATGPDYERMGSDIAAVPDGVTRIVFYRTNESLLYSARKARIMIDGENAGGCALGGFFFRDLSPGDHRLKADMWDAPGHCEVLVTSETGRIYFFQVDPRQQSFWSFAGPTAVSDLLGQSIAVSVASGVGGMAVESYGAECGGVFRLYPVDEPTARERIARLRLSD